MKRVEALKSQQKRLEKSDVNYEFELDKIKFNLLDFYSLSELCEEGCVKTPDNGRLVSDHGFLVREADIFNCFLDCDGVDSKLINFDWFKNHLKWVCLKLYSYDSRLGENFSEKRLLNPANVVQQLKYRYDIEIGNAKRSCLRKIIEKDDTSINRVLVLFISRVLDDKPPSNMVFVELSDGWYPIKALLDSYLATYLKEGRVKIGDKLAVYSSELLNNAKDGSAPLEAPSDMYLKLSVNCVRKVKWHTKLGYLKQQRPLTIRLSSIKSNSSIGAVDVILERIYPIIFVEKNPDGSKVYRNAKQEEQHSYKLMDKNYAYNDEDNEKENDKQCSDLINRAMPQKRNLTETFKIRLVDPSDAKSANNIKSCVLTIWQNANELRDQLVEGQRVVILNLTSTQQQNSEFLDLYNQSVLSVYQEVDTCGVVLMHSANSFHNLIYLSNLSTESNSVVCVCFPKNSDFYGFKECLKYSNAIACLNLKFLRKKEYNKFPCLLATENSIFTQKIANLKFFHSKFNSLTECLEKNWKEKLKSILENLEEEIATLQTQQSNNRTSYSKLNQTFDSTSLKKQLSSSNLRLNNSTIEESKIDRVVEIAKLAQVSMIATRTGVKQPGLVSKNKPFQSPFLTKLAKSDEQNLGVTRPLKRVSDVVDELRKTVENEREKVEEEDEDDRLLSNHDLEAICNSAKRKKV